MLQRLSVTNQWQTATKHMVPCCGCVGLSILAIAWFGLHRRPQASQKILPDHQVSAAPTKIQPNLVAGYGKLPLSFEANQGQTDARVRFHARGGGYTIFLTADEAVLTLRKSQPDMSRFGKFGLRGRLERFGLVDRRAGRWPSLADDLKSLGRSLIPDLSQLVPEPKAGKGAVAAGLESQPQQVMRMRLVGGNAKGRIVGLDELPGRSNYFIGNDPKKWRTNVPSYTRVKYEGVYPGVDLVYYGNQGQLEYDFVVAPGADPAAIRFALSGGLEVGRTQSAVGSGTQNQTLRQSEIQNLKSKIDPSGDLVIALEGGAVRFHKPVVYQPRAPVSASWSAARHSKFTIQNSELVDGRYMLTATNEIRFEVPTYDRRRPLIIDPYLSYSTYLGGSGTDYANGIAVDSAGNAYVTGYTTSTDFPTAKPLQATNKAATGSGTAFVTKLNPTGSALVYSTYLGGSKVDEGLAIAVDAAGNATVTGGTASSDFPTVNPLQGTCGTCSNGYATGFVAKLNPIGSALVYSTYLGGSAYDEVDGIALDAAGNAYLTGYTTSTDFPTANPLQPSNASGLDAIVAKLNPAGSALVYSTYLGGSSSDLSNGIAVDSFGNAYVTGYTTSTDFPTHNPFQATNKALLTTGTNPTAFVAKLNSTGSALVYSTYLGGSDSDSGSGIAVDSSGNAYVTGSTASTDFPTVNAFQATYGGGASDAFVTKFNSAGSALVYSSFLGGSGSDSGTSIAVRSAPFYFSPAAGSAPVLEPPINASVAVANSPYITGYSTSPDFPLDEEFERTCLQCVGGNPSGFVAGLSGGGGLVFSSYFGGSGGDYPYGIAVGRSGNIFLTGLTASTDLPVTPSYLQIKFGGGDSDGFIAKIAPLNAPAVSLSPEVLDFGEVSFGYTSAPQTITLKSVGSEELVITNITTTNQSFAQTNNCRADMPSGADCTISVTFTPESFGRFFGFLSIYDDAVNARSPQVIDFWGEAVP
jgi:hypothetical protein